jgi:putative ABC transport system substrate-binding protein
MRESLMYGSVRGTRGNSRPYRDKRRKFITLLGGVADAWPLAARAQRTAVPVIGFLSSATPQPYADRVRVFHRGLNEAGYVEGQNIQIEYCWAEDDNNRLPSLAAQLVPTAGE